MLRRIRKKIYNLFNLDNRIIALERGILRQHDSQNILLARMLVENLKAKGRLEDIHDAEFSVFSQGGDDGIIQYLVSRIPCTPRFIDIGGGNYQQPDTRLLLQLNNWSGRIIDMTDITTFNDQGLSHFYNLRRTQSFVTAENINDLIKPAEEVGLLNIDIDGNDYWVWKALQAQPTIVVVEFNPIFGLNPITIPYEPMFQRTESDYGTPYCGASLTALHDLATQKGYVLVGTSRQGWNAYFVRKDKVGDVRVLTPEEAYLPVHAQEHRDKHNNRYFFDTPADIIEHFLKDAPFVNVRTGQIESLSA